MTEKQRPIEKLCKVDITSEVIVKIKDLERLKSLLDRNGYLRCTYHPSMHDTTRGVLCDNCYIKNIIEKYLKKNK